MKLMRVSEPETVFRLINEHFEPLDSEPVSAVNAGGRSLAENITSPEDVPGFNRSTVDGYAVVASDTFGSGEGIPALLENAGEIAMGQSAPPMKVGQCFLVHTGGMLPDIADAVVMLEDTAQTGPLVEIYRQVAPGTNVIHRGEDIARGSVVLVKGCRIRAPELGIIASLGIREVKVHRRPLVGIFSSGDELVEPGAETIQPGCIRESNAPALAHQASLFGATALYGGILPDCFDAFLQKSKSMLDQVDLLIFSGGSSVGSRDFTARTMNELGKPGLLIEGVSIQPGKPTLLAACDGKPVLGLPGHPVSALNVFSLFGRKIIDRLSGRSPLPAVPTVKALLSRNVPSQVGRTDYVRVKLVKEGDKLISVPVFGRSGLLRTLAEADGLLVIPAPLEGLQQGAAVEIIIWE